MHVCDVCQGYRDGDTEGHAVYMYMYLSCAVHTYKGHRDVVTDVMWNRSGESLISCSKDSKCLVHHMSEAQRPYAELSMYQGYQGY